MRLLGVNWDVTPLRKITAELAEQHELLRVTLSSIGDAVITTDAQGIVTWLNPIAERMTEWTHQEAEGQPLVQIFNIINEHTRLVTPNPVESCLEHGRIVGLANHTVLISRSGKEYGIADSAAPIKNKSNDILGVVLVFHDVTEQRRLSIEMSYRATHDELTGLVNRSEFEAQLSLSLDRASEFDKSHALMYIDLDRFKLVNDTCGHSAGDLLLQQVSKIMQKCVRTSDTFARIGGDEFGVILEDCSTEQAHRVARLICEHVHEYRFTHSDQQFRIGTSIGLVPLDKRWSTTAAAMQAADRSCYAAKEAGRNRVNLWVDTDKTIQIRQKDMQWATRLQQAVDHDDQFVLYAQRIEGLHSNTSGLHAEVLLRLKDTDGSLIPPNIFLRAAERFHLATLVDRWVLQRAINHLMRLSDISAIEQLCINLSGQSIGDRKFHDEVIDLLSYAGEDICRKICLEITETAAVTRIADSTVFIDNVRELGVQIALDDFGAGASSFGYLKVLKVDILKIDGQYITGMMDDRLDDAAVRCFVDVAKIMGLKTVAEFVKTPQILDRSKELGIDYAQGFLLHEPERLEVVVA
ncbi:hypothetical protein AB833_26800 [Chromatiales bacterium (ex Bugula neritina AB1)]|nr:hypothetical protein AB833_26800 [Chromatiales bacterium (ex Bugula neritina AB1)]